MIRIIYYIILAYFFLGAVGFIFINRKKERTVARNNWVKFLTYFIIINIVFFCIVLGPVFFRSVAIIIIISGCLELSRLYVKSGHFHRQVFYFSLLIFLIISAGFFVFSGMEKELVLYVFLILSIFDSFSQISGQLWGKRKLMPTISPNKTWGGLAGGTLIALISGLLLKNLLYISSIEAIALTVNIILSAFVGDMASSFYKRQYKVKDFSNLIPGHGGFLDRFDSLIASGAWIALLRIVANL
jgi:phosphatidate cytidylyltransferase